MFSEPEVGCQGLKTRDDEELMNSIHCYCYCFCCLLLLLSVAMCDVFSAPKGGG